ncbi:MAG: tRNA (guanosine(46)-N7)-methyltransferase TrmB [Bacteroidales bacterium]|jgi:tRNA (guanine-N7-)-methyltransferase
MEMGRNKLDKFAENLTFRNFFQLPYEEISVKEVDIKGKWHSDFFKNQHPIVLELGCGKGEYTIELAQRHPDKNFIGVDRKGARMWTGCKFSVENELNNVAFIRTQIQFLTNFFAENEISEIWLTFPDPQPKRSKTNKRLTASYYLDIYRQILKPGGYIHLKTDNKLLFDFTIEVIERLKYNLLEKKEDIYASEIDDPALAIQTHYEKMWISQGLPIHYLKFSMI